MRVLSRSVGAVSYRIWLLLAALGLLLVILATPILQATESSGTTQGSVRWYLVGTASIAVVAVALLGFVFGLLALLSLALKDPSQEPLEQLAAGLQARAQLETAMAIREVTREVDEADPAQNVSIGGRHDVGNIDVSSRAIEGDKRTSVERRSQHDHAVPEVGGIAGAVNRFYSEALLQSKVWFLSSVAAAVVGLAVIVWEVVRVDKESAVDAGVKVASAALAGAIAALFYRQANATRKHAAELLTSTQSDRRSETALTVLNSIQDIERREEIAARLVMHLAGGTLAPTPAGTSATTGAAERSASGGSGPTPDPRDVDLGRSQV
jgi:hypothetical protein